ncbi:MAG: type II toxin-antitoxin system RelE/ParE family toxin [Verrucomicrobia bacterium]|nr:type II toxin-antitoxin system RelE/ParE family toxin [Verrucomicrobiota bacterium]
MPDFFVAPEAEADVLEIATYIARDNFGAADRFIDAAYDTFRFLTTQPEIGRVRRFKKPQLKGIRSWRVGGFKNYLIFYRHANDVVSIHRVLHGARDLSVALGAERPASRP